MAYKSLVPNDSELLIVHLAVKMPQLAIDLQGWEFVCFVNHSKFTETKIYDNERQYMVDIMFLVRRNRTIRLVSFRMDPFTYAADLKGQTDKGIFIPEESKFILFSGFVRWPNVSENKTLGMRIANDKIQQCELLVDKNVMNKKFAILLQFTD